MLCFGQWVGGLVLAGLLAADSVRADEQRWSEFRGPQGTGIAADADPPVEFGEQRNRLWKTAIPGKGWSSPVVWGDQIWLTTATEDGRQMFAICVDRATGAIVHNVLVFENEEPRFCHPTNSYASPTPVIEAGRVYVHFGSYGTACLNTETAAVLWQRRDLECNHWRGPGSSPVLVDGRLIVAYDGYDLQYVVALDRQTGDTVWKQDRNIDYGTDNGDRKKAYSTVAVIEHAGRKQVISPSAVETISYDPLTGEELWRVRHGGMNAAARPQYAHGLVYIAAGSGPLSMIAVRPDGSGDVSESHIEWSLAKATPKRPSPLLIGERLYMIDDGGVATCRNARTSELIWQGRVGGNFRASPVIAGGRIYCCSEEGEITVLGTGDEFNILARNRLDDGFQASPAVAGDTLYLRTTRHLYAFEK